MTSILINLNICKNEFKINHQIFSTIHLNNLKCKLESFKLRLNLKIDI